jgi:hypothetical protein
MRSLPPGSFGVAIDFPGAAWGVESSESTLRRVVSDLCRDGYRTELFLGNSRDIAIIEAARQRAPFDAALIDGDHSYEGALADWVDYGCLARIVAFHDIAGENVVTRRTPQPVEVPKVWHHVKAEAKGRTYEFVTDPRHFGIGVIVRPRAWHSEYC